MFYENLQKVCKEKGTTPTTVTVALGISKGTLGQWKNGSSPTGNIVVRFADYLGVTTDRLLTGEDPHKTDINSPDGPVIVVPLELKNVLTAATGGEDDITQEEVDEIAEYWLYIKSKRQNKKG